MALDVTLLDVERPLLFVWLLVFESFDVDKPDIEDNSETVDPLRIVFCSCEEIAGNKGDRDGKEANENCEVRSLYFVPNILLPLDEVLVGIGGVDGTKSSMFRLCLETGTNVERFIGNLMEFN